MKIALPGADGAYDPRLRAADFRGVRPFAAPGRVVPFSATFTAGVGERHVNVWRLPTVPFLIRGAIFSVAGVTQDGTPGQVDVDVQVERHVGLGLFQTLTKGLLASAKFSAGVYAGYPAVFGLKHFNDTSILGGSALATSTPQDICRAFDGRLYVSVDGTNNIFSTSFFHGMRDGASGDRAMLTMVDGGTPPPSLTSKTVYFVVNRTDRTFQVSATQGGAAIDFGGTGAGDHTFFEPLSAGAMLGSNGLGVLSGSAFSGGLVRVSLLPSSGVNNVAATVTGKLILDVLG